MGGEITTDLKSKVLTEINGTADDAYQKMQDKRAEYEAAMKQLSIFDNAMDNAYSEFKAAQFRCSNKNDSTLLTAQSKYYSSRNTYSNQNINVEVLRASLNSDISYCSKMNNSAFIANSILA